MFPEGKPASTTEPVLDLAKVKAGVLVFKHGDFLELDQGQVQSLAAYHPLVVTGVPLQNNWDWTAKTFRMVLPPFLNFQGHSKLFHLSIILSS